MTDWTALLAWIRLRLPGSSPLPQHTTRIAPVEQSKPHVPREYQALYTYLEQRYASVVVLTFSQIEALIGFSLPTPARTEREWWTGSVETRRHSAAWTGAGRTAAPNLGAETTRFERPV